MRAIALALAVTLAGSTGAVAQDEANAIALQKLNALRQHRRDMANRHRAAVIVLNESNVPGVESRLFNEAAVLFSSKGYEIVSQPDAAGAAAGHAKGAAWTPEELAAIADRLQVETVAVATLKEYQAKRRFGLPLPQMTVRTDAHISMDGAVYRRSENQIVWHDTLNHRERNLVGGAYLSRNEARRAASLNTVDKLFSGYFAKKS
jgi:hypothetical protein